MVKRDIYYHYINELNENRFYDIILEDGRILNDIKSDGEEFILDYGKLNSKIIVYSNTKN